jgi:hypothetical protein
MTCFRDLCRTGRQQRTCCACFWGGVVLAHAAGLLHVHFSNQKSLILKNDHRVDAGTRELEMDGYEMHKPEYENTPRVALPSGSGLH